MPFVGNVAKGYREYWLTEWSIVVVNCRRMAVHDPRQRYIAVHEQFGFGLKRNNGMPTREWKCTFPAILRFIE